MSTSLFRSTARPFAGGDEGIAGPSGRAAAEAGGGLGDCAWAGLTKLKLEVDGADVFARR